MLATSAPFALDGTLPGADLIGYLKSIAGDNGDAFGDRVAISRDGSTLAIAAANESSGLQADPADNSAALAGAVYVFARTGLDWALEGYVKAPNLDAGDLFGSSLALNGDGSVLLVGARREDSRAIRVDGDATDNSTADSGAAYVFRRSSGSWAFESYLKAPYGASDLQFGRAVALSADGATAVISSALAAGSSSKPSAAPNRNSLQRFVPAPERVTTVFVYRFDGTVWDYDALFTPGNAGEDAASYQNLAISDDGLRVVLGAPLDDSDATTINGDDSNSNRQNSGAAYVFDDDGTGSWDEVAYLKASNAGANDRFGSSVAISGDGRYVLIGAPLEDSTVGAPADDSLGNSGAVYLYEAGASAWSELAIQKPDTARGGDYWGSSVAISGDGARFATGARFESSAETGIATSVSVDGTTNGAGAVAIFAANATSSWALTRQLKATNTGEDDNFGTALALSGDGETLIVGAPAEDGAATDIDGTDNDDSSDTGAAYLY